MSDELPIPGTDGSCQCCGTREAVVCRDIDLGFVCASWVEHLVCVEIGLRNLAAEQQEQEQ